MILILSDKNDLSTCEVISWIDKRGGDYLVVTEQDVIHLTEVDEDGHFTFIVKERIVRSRQISGYWYRRGRLILKNNNLSSFEESLGIRKLLESSLRVEMGRIVSYLHSVLRKVKHIGSLYSSEINKLFVLNTCRELEISTPASLLTTRKSRLLQFIDKYGEVITKAATSTIFAGNDDVHLAAYTEAVDHKILSGLPEEFAPSFFQERIEKLIEIRSVYLEGKFYSMAIFSQRNEKTQIDFRHYDRSLPNRRVPFALPDAYSEKVKLMLDKFKLDCCSVDTLVTQSGKFYFLEVNPVGQFGMTSYPCNYQIEKRIADFLLK